MVMGVGVGVWGVPGAGARDKFADQLQKLWRQPYIGKIEVRWELTSSILFSGASEKGVFDGLEILVTAGAVFTKPVSMGEKV
jgi:hypothetical protein